VEAAAAELEGTALDAEAVEVVKAVLVDMGPDMKVADLQAVWRAALKAAAAVVAAVAL
jgi:hypothetical protein